MDGYKKKYYERRCFYAQKLFKKSRKSKKHVEIYKKLWEKFRTIRAKGYRVNFYFFGQELVFCTDKSLHQMNLF